jgi:hypothetical protein
MNYKTIIIAIILYVVYTTYVSSHNNEFFNNDFNFFNFFKLQSNKTSSKINSLMPVSQSYNKLIPITSPINLSSSGKYLKSVSSNSVSSNSVSSNSVLSTSEQFTQKEMNAYPTMLKKNCEKTSNIYKKLKKNNLNRCGPGIKGKTNRDTINNKRLCWTDIRREIVSGMDAESNCVMASLNKEPIDMSKLAEMRFPSRSAVKSKAISQYDLTAQGDLFEGPNYINQYFVGLSDPTKGAGFAEITGEQKGKTGKYADINSYTDVGFTSDPAFLYRLANYNKNKSKTEQFEQYNQEQMRSNPSETNEIKYKISNGNAYDMAGRLKPEYFDQI